jgi:hypothetical protein
MDPAINKDGLAFEAVDISSHRCVEGRLGGEPGAAGDRTEGMGTPWRDA